MIGQVLRSLHRLSARLVERGAGPEGVHAARNHLHLIEAVLIRQSAGRVIGQLVAAEVPFAKKRSGVTGLLQMLGQGRLGSGGELAFLRVAVVVRVNAPACLMTAREEPHARWHTDLTGDIGIRAKGALGREPVEIRRADVFAARHADVGIAHVIAEDDDEVRTCSRHSCLRCFRARQECLAHAKGAEEEEGMEFRSHAVMVHARMFWMTCPCTSVSRRWAPLW